MGGFAILRDNSTQSLIISLEISPVEMDSLGSSGLGARFTNNEATGESGS